jgi:hypothetical protein
MSVISLSSYLVAKLCANFFSSFIHVLHFPKP